MTQRTDDAKGIDLVKEVLLSKSKEIQLMRKEYESTISLGWNLRSFSESLAGTRDTTVQALEFLDSLTATVSNIQTACSAIPERSARR